jgi:hypothetical protein
MATALTKLDNNANMLDILNTLNELNNQQALLNNKLYMLLQDQNLEVTNDMTLSELIDATEEGFSNMSAGSSDKDTEIENLRAQLVSLNSQITDLNNQLAGKVTPVGTAVAGNVLSGKTFINSTGQTITGTMTNRGGAQTVTPGTSNKTLYSGYYSGNITVSGDTDLTAANIKSGVNIFGVTGTYIGSSSVSFHTKTPAVNWDVDSSTTYTISANFGYKPSMIIVEGRVTYYDEEIELETWSYFALVGVGGNGIISSYHDLVYYGDANMMMDLEITSYDANKIYLTASSAQFLYGETSIRINDVYYTPQ